MTKDMIYKMKKVTFVIFVIFVILTFILSGVINNRYVEKNNMTIQDKYISDNLDGYRYPDERTIILRMDDVEGNSLNLVTNLTDTIIKRNMSLTIGVIPYPDRNINEDIILYNYLRNITQSSRIEIVQHGTYHTSDELKDYNESKIYEVTKLGLEKLNDIKISKHPIITYSTPYEVYTNETTISLSKLGFKILTSRREKIQFDGYMLHIGYDTVTSVNSMSIKLTSVDYILESCRKSLDIKNLCTIDIHPNDYRGNDNNIDPNKYSEFIKLLDGLEKLDVRYETFRDLIN